MRINKIKLKNVKLLRADCLQGKEIKDSAAFIKVLKEELADIKRGQQLHRESLVLCEQWGLENLIALIDCLE